MNFKAQIGGDGKRNRTKLPQGLHAKMRFTLPNTRGETVVDSYLDSEVRALPKHDAYFVITSCLARPFGRYAQKPNAPTFRPMKVRFTPHINRFALSSQLKSIAQLCAKAVNPGSRLENWQQVLLNQLHDSLPEVDLIENDEKKGVLAGMKMSRGRFNIIHGVAGTGKTLLQMALTRFMVMLGYKCIACSPANENADQITVAEAGMINVKIKDVGGNVRPDSPLKTASTSSLLRYSSMRSRQP